MLFTPVLLISCIIIFVLLYLFINTIDDSKKWLNIILAILITPILYFYLWYPISTIFLPYHHHKQFNSSEWSEKPGLRYEMIDNMIETDFLTGKSKEDVSKLLGKVQWLSWNDANKNFDPNVWNYGLGLIPGAFEDIKEDVEITFKNNKVTLVKLYQANYTFEVKKEETNKKLDSINARFNTK
ncbi:MAG: hypothetical protein HRT69_08595 [Flavobacteriaceae bacterium]|nr:hypothetical protein [Flavobacteriaceae bacterium]